MSPGETGAGCAGMQPCPGITPCRFIEDDEREEAVSGALPFYVGSLHFRTP